MYEKRNEDQSIARNVKVNEGMLFKHRKVHIKSVNSSHNLVKHSSAWTVFTERKLFLLQSWAGLFGGQK